MSKLARFDITLDGQPIAESPQFVNCLAGMTAVDCLTMLERHAMPDPDGKSKPRFGVPGAKSMTFIAVSDTPDRMEIDVRGFSTAAAAAEFQARLNEIRRGVVARRRARESKLDRAVELAERHDAKLAELAEWREDAEAFNETPWLRSAERHAVLTEQKRQLVSEIRSLRGQVRAVVAEAGLRLAA